MSYLTPRTRFISVLFRSKRSTQLTLLSSLLVVSGIVITYGVMLGDFAVDDAYITFRHAQNLVRGDGFTFNSGDRLLSTTSPLHALLLAIIALLGLTNFPLIAVWLSAVSMIVLCVSLLFSFLSLREASAGLLCILLIISQHWFYRFFSLETIVVLALNVTAVALALREHWGWAGVAAGFAMIGRPDSIIVASIVAVFALMTSKPFYRGFWKYAAAASFSYGAWFAFSLFYFGTPFPNTLQAKSGFATWTVFIDSLWPKMLSDLTPGYWQLGALLVIFAGIGIVDLLIKRSPLLIFPIWAALHTVGYTLLRIAYPFAWYYAPLIFITLFLASVGGMAVISFGLRWRHTNRKALSWVATTGMILLFMFILGASIQGTWNFVSTYKSAYYSGARDQVYRQVGHWLAENSTPDATVALVEVGTIGYVSQRRIIDLMGLVTYELRNLPKQGSYQESIDALQPDYIVGIRGLPPDPDLVGIAGYTVVQEYPKGKENLFEDVVIYKLESTAGYIP